MPGGLLHRVCRVRKNPKRLRTFTVDSYTVIFIGGSTVKGSALSNGCVCRRVSSSQEPEKEFDERNTKVKEELVRKGPYVCVYVRMYMCICIGWGHLQWCHVLWWILHLCLVVVC